MSALAQISKLRPIQKLIPRDGMPVTLDTWQKAHQYHEHLQRASLLAVGGCGILNGLEVRLVKNDPLRLTIGAGVAIDPEGQLLVLANPTTLAVNEIHQAASNPQPTNPGAIYVILQMEQEATPHNPNQAATPDQSYFAQEACSVRIDRAGVSTLKPGVELARIDRSQINAPLKWPTALNAPGKDEVDLRFRLRLANKAPMLLAVVKVEETVAPDHLHGWHTLAREVAYTRQRPVVIDEWNGTTLPTAGYLQKYDMICVVGCDYFNLDQVRRQYLYEYVEQGGVLFYESCRQVARSSPSTADQQFQDWVNKLAGAALLQQVSNTDPLTRVPYLFPRLPRGYEASSPIEVKVTRGIGQGVVVYSNVDYGCAFHGKLANSHQTGRNDLRETLEWGHNLLALASRRQQ